MKKNLLISYKSRKSLSPADTIKSKGFKCFSFWYRQCFSNISKHHASKLIQKWIEKNWSEHFSKYCSFRHEAQFKCLQTYFLSNDWDELSASNTSPNLSSKKKLLFSRILQTSRCTENSQNCPRLMNIYQQLSYCWQAVPTKIILKTWQYFNLKLLYQVSLAKLNFFHGYYFVNTSFAFKMVMVVRRVILSYLHTGPWSQYNSIVTSQQFSLINNMFSTGRESPALPSQILNARGKQSSSKGRWVCKSQDRAPEGR